MRCAASRIDVSGAVRVFKVRGERMLSELAF